MRIESLRIGMKVKHPAYGAGSVVAINERTVDIRFDDGGVRTVSPDNSAIGPAEATVEVSGLDKLSRVLHRLEGIKDVFSVVREVGKAPTANGKA